MCVGDRLGAVSAASLREDSIHMSLDGGLTHEELPSDLGIRAPSGDQAEHLGLSLGQPVGKGAVPGPRCGQGRHLDQSSLDCRVKDRLA